MQDQLDEAINIQTPFGRFRIKAWYDYLKGRPSQNQALCAKLRAISGVVDVMPLSSSLHIDVEVEELQQAKAVIKAIREAYRKASCTTEEPRQVA